MVVLLLPLLLLFDGLEATCVGVLLLLSGVIEFDGLAVFGLARRIVPVSPTKGLGGGGNEARLNEEPVNSGVLQTGSSPTPGGGGNESRERLERNISGGGGGKGSLSDSPSSATPLEGDGGGGRDVIESIYDEGLELILGAPSYDKDHPSGSPFTHHTRLYRTRRRLGLLTLRSTVSHWTRSLPHRRSRWYRTDRSSVAGSMMSFQGARSVRIGAASSTTVSSG